MADPKSALDPRLTPARPDLAAKHLEGKVKAARYSEGIAFEVFDPIAPVRRAPSHDAALETEALKGERVTIYDRDMEGWAWGQLQSDGYVGWLPDNALVLPRSTPTHKVIALRTFAFPGPSIKLPPVESLPLGARIEIIKQESGFAITSQRHYLPAQHVAPPDTVEADFVAVAEKFVGTPIFVGRKVLPRHRLLGTGAGVADRRGESARRATATCRKRRWVRRCRLRNGMISSAAI